MSDSPTAGSPPQSSQKPDMREVLTKLLENADKVSETEKPLLTAIRDLAIASKDPTQFHDTSIQRNIATAARDFAMVTGKELDLSPAAREELTKYTAPFDTSSTKADGPPKAATATQAASNPMAEVLTKLRQVADKHPELNEKLGQLLWHAEVGTITVKEANKHIAGLTIDFEKSSGQKLDLSPAGREQIEKYTAASNSSSQRGDSAPKETATSQGTTDPIRDVLKKLVANLDQLPSSAKGLGNKIQQIEAETRDLVCLNQKSVQHEIAYATEDFEKTSGKKLNLATTQREQITKLAGSAPGLGNEQLIDLLRRTRQIGDTNLVSEIRRYAKELGLRQDQDTPDSKSRIDSLESSARVATRATQPGADKGPADASIKADPLASPEAGKPPSNGAASERQRVPNVATQRNGQTGPSGEQQQMVQNAVLKGGILDTLTAAIRGSGQPNTAPWEPQPSPFGDRLRAFSDKVAGRDQDSGIARVEKSARAAMDALDGFCNTEGAGVMNRLQAAARADPGGMAGVLSEMRDGGKFGDLRQAFNKALSDDRGFAEAYDRAAGALARYGEGREKVEQIIAKRPDIANLTAKFDQLDKEVGERANSIPSRTDGKNMLDDIGKNVAEIIQKATDAVRAVFARTQSAGPSASPGA